MWTRNRFWRGCLLATCVCALAAAGCGDDGGDDGADADSGVQGGTGGGSSQPGPLMYTGEFTMGETIPPRHKCPSSVVGSGMGDNLSPALQWTGGPAETESFAVVLYDTRYGFFHWAVWDIPADATGLPEGIEPGFEVADPAGAHQRGGPGGDPNGYFGPCSDAGPAAGTYEYRLHALDVPTLDLADNAAPDTILMAVEDATLEQTVWEGTPE